MRRGDGGRVDFGGLRSRLLRPRPGEQWEKEEEVSESFGVVERGDEGEDEDV